MDQMLINALIGFLVAVVSFVLRRIFEVLNNLQKRDMELFEKVNHIEVVLAGQYVSRQQFDGAMALVFEKLDKISEKMSQKADRLRTGDKNAI